MSWFFTSSGQSIGALLLSSVLPMNIQGWFPCCPRDFQESSPAPWSESINFSRLSLLYGPTLTSIHDYWKTIALTTWTFVSKVMSLLFNTLSRFVIAFLPRSKHLLISWLQSLSAVILEPKKIKSVTVSTFSPSICHEVMGPDVMILVFWMLSFMSAFSLSSFTLIKRLFSCSSLSAIRVVSSAYLRLLIFLPTVLIPACDSSSPTFHRIYCAYKLTKKDIQPWLTLFSILNQSVLPCLVLTVVLDLNRYLRRQVKWSGIPISLRIFQFAVIHIVKGFRILSEADIFLEFCCFFYNLEDIDNLIFGSFAFSKSSCTSESAQFTHCWSLVWRILNTALLEYEMSTVVW